jgi:MraZ protein
MFRGQFTHSIDAKGRVSLPARFRENGSDPRFVLTGALFDPCLHLFPLKAWEDFEAKVAGLPSLDPDVVRFRRMYVSLAVECELDAAGRILVPHELRQKAKLEREVLWAGMGPHLELWSKSEWELGLSMTPEQVAAFKRAVMEQIRI